MIWGCSAWSHRSKNDLTISIMNNEIWPQSASTAHDFTYCGKSGKSLGAGSSTPRVEAWGSKTDKHCKLNEIRPQWTGKARSHNVIKMKIWQGCSEGSRLKGATQKNTKFYSKFNRLSTSPWALFCNWATVCLQSSRTVAGSEAIWNCRLKMIWLVCSWSFRCCEVLVGM